MSSIPKNTKRIWLVRWMYAAAAMHLLVGALLPWIANASIFNNYHHGIELAFWGDAWNSLHTLTTSGAATVRAQQVWWISLFGPTVQSTAIWMGALVYFGDQQRSSFAWKALIIGIVVWAPQDMLISLQADCWNHVWVDLFAVVMMLPPLIWLWREDQTTLTKAAS
ncbi:cell division protein [Undibacterium sp. RTI2.1]|uniref:cell division protein n=1 Tax=unclassified Undibacterium TaxID=2630295 RepID=UPI002AB3BFAB|nr:MULTISPECIES: cell division protein [unclassified Undibacterium]MDY7538651.1 cell division protein [Undibacterium sp. 5I1]MEB0030280.1 cell division protein [Undibacterium sp. RTI2.1]MEB0116904.1 cell division protein [Undibacterium sp. RTI2.2]MEB0232140.1 cell division protein [Undibacterium sp. 10I3]MEB0259454.1 cell division protein [Undibacterium sp. 5I1]